MDLSDFSLRSVGARDGFESQESCSVWSQRSSGWSSGVHPSFSRRCSAILTSQPPYEPCLYCTSFYAGPRSAALRNGLRAVVKLLNEPLRSGQAYDLIDSKDGGPAPYTVNACAKQ